MLEHNVLNDSPIFLIPLYATHGRLYAFWSASSRPGEWANYLKMVSVYGDLMNASVTLTHRIILKWNGVDPKI